MEDEEPAPWEEDDEKPVAGSHGQALEAEEAENLIGLDEAAENDPLKHYVVMQNQIRRLQEDQSRIERQEANARSAQGDQRVAAEMQVLAAREVSHGHALELREVCRRLSDRHEKAVEAELQLLEGTVIWNHEPWWSKAAIFCVYVPPRVVVPLLHRVFLRRLPAFRSIASGSCCTTDIDGLFIAA